MSKQERSKHTKIIGLEARASFGIVHARSDVHWGPEV